MDKEIAQYINTLLAEKEREVLSKQAYLDKIDRSVEIYFTEYQEIEWELSIIYKAQKSMDYIIEEDELNYPPHIRGDVIGKAKEAFAHTNKKENN